MQSDSITASGPGGSHASAPRRRERSGNGFRQVLAALNGGRATPARQAPRGGLAAGTAAVALSAQAARPDAFRDRIALAEGSRQLYSQRNPASGALGRYQLVPQALRDLGWQDGAGGWTALARRHGVTSDADFLASPAAQETAMTAYLARTEQQLARNGSLAQAGGEVSGLDGQAIPLTEAGLVAAAHRRGAGSVARYLAHRAATPEAVLTPQQRRAFASVERRLRDFAELPYAVAARRAEGTV
jgi:hypothetical protein